MSETSSLVSDLIHDIVEMVKRPILLLSPDGQPKQQRRRRRVALRAIFDVQFSPFSRGPMRRASRGKRRFWPRRKGPRCRPLALGQGPRPPPGAA
jgi:hypothetical protein